MLARNTRKYPDLTPRNSLRKASEFGVGAAMVLPSARSGPLCEQESDYQRKATLSRKHCGLLHPVCHIFIALDPACLAARSQSLGGFVPNTRFPSPCSP